jgi:hypothetical protein
MRQLALACVLVLLATVQGCGGGDGGSPTEPANPRPRGNWIGTISGTHTALGVQGTCTLEMNLDTTFNGHWWIDCPNGARSQGQALGASANNLTVFTFLTTSPASNCPWVGFGIRAAAVIEGDFEVIDCITSATRSTGTFEVRPR